MTNKVLFVDDERSILESIQRSLRKEPFSIVTAGSGAAGLELLANDAEIALVVSDDSMPEMTGTQFLSQVRAKHPDVIRLMLTAKASLDAALSAQTEGSIYRFLTKPFSPLDLSYMIQDALLLRDLTKHACGLLQLARYQAQLLDYLQPANPSLRKARYDPTMPEDLRGMAFDIPALVQRLATEIAKLSTYVIAPGG